MIMAVSSGFQRCTSLTRIYAPFSRPELMRLCTEILSISDSWAGAGDHPKISRIMAEAVRYLVIL
jgi:hypothetical protein